MEKKETIMEYLRRKFSGNRKNMITVGGIGLICTVLCTALTGFGYKLTSIITIAKTIFQHIPT